MAAPLNAFDVWPPLDKLDFSRNCTIYGQWLSSYIAPNPWDPTTPMRGSIPLSLSLLDSALPTDWEMPSALANVNLTESQLYGLGLEWWTMHIYNYENETDKMWYSDEAFIDHTVWLPAANCPAEFCKAVAFTGNPDLTGIGVMVSYYIEAILATMYLLAFTIWSIRRHYEEKSHRTPSSTGRPHLHRTFTGSSGVPGRILDAFRGSLDPFLGATMLMSIAMLVAAIYTSIIKGADRIVPPNLQALPTGSAIYDMVLSLLAATFSVFPVMLVYALMRHPDRHERSHRKWMRRVVLVVIWGIGAAEVFLAPRGELDYDERHSTTDTFWCDQRGGPQYWAGLKASQFLVIGAPLTWLVITVFLVTGFKIPGVVDLKWVRRWRSIWRMLIAWVNLLLMWGILGYFTVLRHRIIHTAGGLDNEDTWTFGQILAVATWVPSVAEFFYILFFGLEENLNTHIPPEYKVVRRENEGLIPVHEQPNAHDDNIPLIKGSTTPVTSVYAPSTYTPSTFAPSTYSVEITGGDKGAYSQVGQGHYQGAPAVGTTTSYAPEYNVGATNPWNNNPNPGQTPWHHWQGTGW